jgi:lipoyl(octanoyl) transferase
MTRSNLKTESPIAPALKVRNLGLQDYESVWRDMQAFTQNRDASTVDELWVVQHPPVYTLGLNGKRDHLIEKTDIPVIPVDRGGQITYHGPGQLVIYVLMDIQRMGLGVRHLVDALEKSIVDLLAEFNIEAHTIENAPGVYVDNSKVAALGLRIKRGCSYHGLSLNIDMDLQPFQNINPCGYPGLTVIQLKDLGVQRDIDQINARLLSHLMSNLR